MWKTSANMEIKILIVWNYVMKISPPLKSLIELMENHYGMKHCITEYTNKHLEPLHEYNVGYHRPFVHVAGDTMIVFCYYDTDNEIDFDGWVDDNIKRFGIGDFADPDDLSSSLSYAVIFSKSEKEMLKCKLKL